jgi:acetoin utilization deacetylase AcuC-like enzyme
MKKTGYLYDSRFLLHDTGPYHPECTERLQVIHQGVQEAGLLKHLVSITAAPPDMKWIESVHTRAYIKRFEEVCLNGHRSFDSEDNQMCTDTYEVAQLAVGGILETVRKMMDGEIDNAFCAVRPPGHHAEADQAMGFCYFNNVAIAARYLQHRWGIRRVAIIDFDVHHGNGSQHIFDKDPGVFYYSIHQHPSFAYPGTGRDFDEGEAEGKGYTRNSPVLPGKGDEEYRRAFEKYLFPAMADFKPEVILLSTGFDAHQDDELADMRVTTEGYTYMAKAVCRLAREYADGRLISILEGGYNLERLPELAVNHIGVLLEK